MMHRCSRQVWTALLCAMGVMLVSGLHSAAAAPLVTEAPAGVPSAPGKPQPPIALDYELLGLPRLGAPLALRVSAEAEAGVRTLRLEIGAEPRLALAASTAEALSVARPGAPLTRTVTVTPRARGRLYVRVTARGERNGRVLTRSALIPLDVDAAGGAAPSVGMLEHDAAGLPVIVMPAAAMP
jgi:hypothetical protein